MIVFTETYETLKGTEDLFITNLLFAIATIAFLGLVFLIACFIYFFRKK